MDINAVKELDKEYKIKREQTNYENEEINNVSIAIYDVLIYWEVLNEGPHIYIKAVIERRFEKAMRDLETLLGN